jgi:hypothetical protein
MKEDLVPGCDQFIVLILREIFNCCMSEQVKLITAYQLDFSIYDFFLFLFLRSGYVDEGMGSHSPLHWSCLLIIIICQSFHMDYKLPAVDKRTNLNDAA